MALGTPVTSPTPLNGQKLNVLTVSVNVLNVMVPLVVADKLVVRLGGGYTDFLEFLEKARF